jgi:hypothetical protein
MSERINPSNRAILQAIAGNHATEVTAEQALQAADGLAGHPRDGNVDQVEAAALVAAARWSLASGNTQNGLRDLLASGKGRIAIEAGPQLPTRFPGYLDVDSLSVNQYDLVSQSILLTDKNGNGVALWRQEADRPTLSAAFARKGDDPRLGARITLNASENETIARQMSRSLLRTLAATPPAMKSPDFVQALSPTATTTPSAADEHDLSGYSGWTHSQPAGHGMVQTGELADGTHFRFTLSPTDLTVSYYANKEWSQPRHLTPNEVASLAVSKQIADVDDLMYRSTGIESSLLRIIWRSAMNRDE